MLCGAGGAPGDGEEGDAAFLTERMALAGEASLPLADGRGDPDPLPRIRARMRAASSTLIELLWLLATIESFSAASRTSLLSRPRSRDNS
jgi:hypothetical protein